jgi:hypothetical protein
MSDLQMFERVLRNQKDIKETNWDSDYICLDCKRRYGKATDYGRYYIQIRLGFVLI